MRCTSELVHATTTMTLTETPIQAESRANAPPGRRRPLLSFLPTQTAMLRVCTIMQHMAERLLASIDENT